MAASAIIAAVATVSGVVTGSIAIGAAFKYFLISTAMGAALNALTPKPSISAASRGYNLRGESGAALDHQIVYGEARVGGVRVYDASTGGNNEFLHRVLAFAGHEIDSYQQIYLNDEVVTLDGSGNVTAPAQYVGFVRIKTYLGTTTQAADPDLVAATSGLTDGIWTTNHRLQGIAYVYVRFQYNQDAFPNGVPSVSVKIRGKKVFDPRTSTTAWSDNPALCVRDYLTSAYGLAQPSGRIDDALVIAAANICDQTVEAEKRYTCNGAFVTAAAPSDVLTNLLTSMGGLLWYGQGKWRMKAAAWTTPTVTFDENDLRSGISLSTRHSRRDNFNSVKGTFAGDETEWQVTDYPQVSDPAFLTADNNLPNVLDFSLPFTSSSKTAQRVARIALNRNREQLTFSAAFGMRAFQVQVGDFVNITNTRFGWTNKAFEVVEWTFGLTDGLDIHVNMTLREISEGVFTGVNGELFELNNTTLPSAFTGLEVNSLTPGGGGRTQGDGTFVNSTFLSWNAATSSFVSYYEVEWKPLADSVYSSTVTSDTSIELTPIIDGIEYVYRVRAVTVLGNKGPFTSVQFTSGGDTTAPGLPTSLSAVGEFRYIVLSWTRPVDADFNYVEIYENDTNTTVGATLIGISAGDNFVRGNLSPGVTKFYFFKSVDFSGNASGFTSSVFATVKYIDGADFEAGIVNLFLDQGLGPIASGDTFPVSPSNGDLFFLTTDGQLYVYNATATRWELKVEPGSIVASDKIVANTITGGLLATSGIITNSAQIENALITAAKIGDLQVERIKLATGAVSTFDFITKPVTFNGQTTYGTQVLVDSISFSFSTDDNLTPERTVFIPRIASGPVQLSLAAGSFEAFFAIIIKRDRGGVITNLFSYSMPIWYFQTDGVRMSAIQYAPSGLDTTAGLAYLDKGVEYISGDTITFEVYYQRNRTGSVNAAMQIVQIELAVQEFFR
jgi:hypothetical protein